MLGICFFSKNSAIIRKVRHLHTRLLDCSGPTRLLDCSGGGCPNWFSKPDGFLTRIRLSYCIANWFHWRDSCRLKATWFKATVGATVALREMHQDRTTSAWLWNVNSQIRSMAMHHHRAYIRRSGYHDISQASDVEHNVRTVGCNPCEIAVPLSRREFWVDADNVVNIPCCTL